MKLTSYCTVIFLFYSLVFLQPVQAQPEQAASLFSEKRDQLLVDQAWVLKNLGEYTEAEKIYQDLLKKKMYY